jgi:hypothetical protein
MKMSVADEATDSIKHTDQGEPDLVKVRVPDPLRFIARADEARHHWNAHRNGSESPDHVGLKERGMEEVRPKFPKPPAALRDPGPEGIAWKPLDQEASGSSFTLETFTRFPENQDS